MFKITSRYVLKNVANGTWKYGWLIDIISLEIVIRKIWCFLECIKLIIWKNRRLIGFYSEYL